MQEGGDLRRAFGRLKDPLFPYWTASVYGFRKWISRYGYYPKFLPLCIYTDHGPGDNGNLPAPHEYASDAPVQFYHSSEAVERWHERSDKECHILYSPFVFARRKLRILPDSGRSGSIYFVSHGNSALLDTNPEKLYLDELKNISEKYRPITVCLHFNEVCLGYVDFYNQNGYSVVTAGDPTDQEFTERFYRILSRAKYVISNQFGSYALYAIEMGLPFGLYGTEPAYVNLADPNIEEGQYISYLKSDYYQQAVALCNGLPGEELTSEQVAFARHYLGLDEGVGRVRMAIILYKSLVIWLVGKLKKRLVSE